jgi:hypothetical protein
MAREFRVDHDKLRDPQTITQENIKLFKEQGLDIHRHEVERLEDDPKIEKRVLRVKNTKYYGPWSKRG